MRDFSNFDILLLHLKLQTNFIQHCATLMPSEFSIKLITKLNTLVLTKLLKPFSSIVPLCARGFRGPRSACLSDTCTPELEGVHVSELKCVQYLIKGVF